MAKIFDADEIQLNLIRILSGTADPSAGAGVTRTIGSLYARAQAAAVGLWQKLTAPNTGWVQLAQSLAWTSVKDFGATGDGVTDDTTAIQNAINQVAGQGGGVVWFPYGTYLISQLTLNAVVGVQLRGSGGDSVLKWSFNAAGAAGSMITLKGASRANTFENLRFDGSGLTNPAASRENHLLQIGDAASNVIETHVVACFFGGMVANSGDGVSVQGVTGNLVSRIWIRDSVLDGCSRWGIGLRQGIQYLWVIDNYFTNNETDIACVANAADNSDCFQIQGNILNHTGTVQHAMRFEGDAAGLLTRMACAENHILAGFATFSNLQYCQIGDNEIFSGVYASADPVVRIFGVFKDSLFASNIIDRQAGSSAGPCLTVEKSVGAPTQFGVRNNNLLNEIATSNLMTFVDCTRFAATGNMCRSSDAGATSVMAIDVQAVTVALDDCQIIGNGVSAAANLFKAAIRLLANGANVSGVVVMAGNIGNQIDAGLQFEIGGGGGNFTGNLIQAPSNCWNATTTDFVNVGGAGVIPRVGFNAGTFGSQLFSGDGSPEGVVTARVSSMYLRRDGGQATAVYYKESGTGNTGWVGIGGCPIPWGVGDAGTVATALFFVPGYIAAATATEVQASMTRPGTIRNLRVQVAGAGTGAATVTFTVRKNGADTTLTCNLANTATGLASDTTHTFTVVSTDLVSISILKSGAVAAGQTNVIATYELN